MPLFVANILTQIGITITDINLGTVCYLNKIVQTSRLIFFFFFTSTKRSS